MRRRCDISGIAPELNWRHNDLQIRIFLCILRKVSAVQNKQMRNFSNNLRRFLPLVVLGFLSLAATGCKKARIRAQLKELMGSTIVLPERLSASV